MAQSSLANYGINVGPMFISWALRFMNRQVEDWTGKAMVRAQKAQRKAARANETPEEKASRRAARKLAKKEAQERSAAQAAAAAASAPPPPPPPEWASASSFNGTRAPPPAPSESQAHEDFLKEVVESEPLDPDFEDEDFTSGFDELD